MIRKIIDKNKIYWSQKEFVSSIVFGTLFLLASLFINYSAGNFATEKAGNGVSDLFLDNVPLIDMGFLLVYGAIALIFFVLIVLIYEPRYLPFTLKALAMFVIIRSIFIILTHIGPYYEFAPLPPNKLIGKIAFGGDLFFSGHTGIPFLMALIFWKLARLRFIFIIISIVFGISVLLSHIHYSIDVVAAFFITYAIFEMAKNFFPKSYKLISE
ncbi:MAG: phosphatase PAP2-related protein [Spirochaetota bacterium]